MASAYIYDCDYYYLEYNQENRDKNGIIYRHLSNNNKIQYIEGKNDTEIIILDNLSKKKEIKTKLKKLKYLLHPNKITFRIPKLGNDYMDVYDFNNSDYENYYKKISLCHLIEDDNICNTIDINYDETTINIGMLFCFIKTSIFDINDIKIEYKAHGSKIFTKTTTSFREYKDCFRDDINFYDCLREKLIGGTNAYKDIDCIKTEQQYIKHDTIMFYFHNSMTKIKPITIEYNYNDRNYYIIDGNHRVAYHIINNYEYIPAIIIYKRLDIDIENTTKKSRR